MNVEQLENCLLTIIIILSIIVILLKPLLVVCEYYDKTIGTERTRILNNIKFLESHCNHDLTYIKEILRKKTHPHINIINDNFKDLIKLVNKKDLILKSTLDENKIIKLRADISLIINKYINLVNNLNENFVEKDLQDLESFNSEINNIIHNLNNGSIDINDVIHKHYTSIKNSKKETINFTVLKTYLSKKDIIEYYYLEKLLKNNCSIYYELITEMLYVILEYIEALRGKENFVQGSLSILINKKIQTIILNYINLLKVLDTKTELSNDNDIDEYGELLDEIIKDVKNKNAVF